MSLDAKSIVEKFKKGPTKYNEDVHCEMLVNVMTNRHKGTMSAFCIDAVISETTFYNWIDENEVFADLYSFCKMYSRETWEVEGRELKDMTMPMGTISYAFEYWKMIGWSRFGISKNSRVKLKLKADDTPDKHYAQLLKQAASGDFTAGEIKQLMEAINVGLNTHHVFKLQEEINQLKSYLVTINENSNAHNSVTTKRIAQKD